VPSASRTGGLPAAAQRGPISPAGTRSIWRDFNRAILITTSGFTPDARQEASRLGVLLYDGEHLLWLLRHHLHREYTITDRARRSPPIKMPPQ
jgi:restriction endonuclease Mrr